MLALLDHYVKELPEDLQAVAGPDARQARVVWQRFIQVLAQIKADTEPVGN